MPATLSPDRITSHLGDVLVALNEVDVHEPAFAAEHAAYHTALEALVAIVHDLSDQLAETKTRVNLLEARGGDFTAGMEAIGESAVHPTLVPALMPWRSAIG